MSMCSSTLSWSDCTSAEELAPEGGGAERGLSDCRCASVHAIDRVERLSDEVSARLGIDDDRAVVRRGARRSSVGAFPTIQSGKA